MMLGLINGKCQIFLILFHFRANIYPDGSAIRELLHQIHDEYVLVTFVDNNFVKPTVIFEMLEKMLNP